MKKLLHYVKANYKYILFFLFFFVVNLFFFRKMYMDRSKRNIFLLLIACFCIFEIVGAILIKILDKKQISIEKQFLICGVVLGMFYLLVLPIGTVPDESAHFRRAYEISEGHLVSDKNKDGVGGRKLPTSISKVFSFDVKKINYKNVYDLISSTKDKSKRSFQTFGNTSLYAAICYLPQTIGILVGRIFHLPMVLIAYLARLANLAFFLAVIYFSIKYIPIHKKLIMLITFLPISMQAAASCQPDALTTATAIALTSFTLYKIKEKKQLTRNQNLLMCVLAVVMSMCKIVYIPICLILYLLPDEAFKSHKDKYIKITILGAIVVVINLIWLLISSTYLVEFQEGVNSALQAKNIILHPIRYCCVLFDTINQYGMYYFFTSFGSYLGYFNMILSEVYLFLYFFFMLYILFSEKTKDKLLTNKNRLLIAFIVLICILLIFTSIYVQWTAYKADIILGVQGRYFIPLFLLIALLLQALQISVKKENSQKYCFLILLMVNVYSIMTVISYHL